MMIGGGMMLGIGLLMMLVVFGLPILLIVAVVWGLLGRRAGPAFSPSPALPRASAPAASPTRYCAHCGQGLQADWTHCPKCGAPIAA